MKKDVRSALIVVVAAAALFGAGYAGLALYSGTSPMFYTVESGSMMHSDNSRIGIIDTGDIVYVRDVSKAGVTTYVEAYGTGYKKFGDYGDVILYKIPGKTIIHRAILYAEPNGDGTWNIPGLETYGGVLEHTAGEPGKWSGTLTFKDFGYNGREFNVDLDAMGSGAGGYVTMGDNNGITDQEAGLAGLVTNNMTIAVAKYEIPWIGCIKLYATGNNTDQIPSNSPLLLIVTVVAVIAAAVAADVLIGKVRGKKKE